MPLPPVLPLREAQVDFLLQETPVSWIQEKGRLGREHSAIGAVAVCLALVISEAHGSPRFSAIIGTPPTGQTPMPAWAYAVFFGYLVLVLWAFWAIVRGGIRAHPLRLFKKAAPAADGKSCFVCHQTLPETFEGAMVRMYGNLRPDPSNTNAPVLWDTKDVAISCCPRCRELARKAEGNGLLVACGLLFCLLLLPLTVSSYWLIAPTLVMMATAWFFLGWRIEYAGRASSSVKDADQTCDLQPAIEQGWRLGDKPLQIELAAGKLLPHNGNRCHYCGSAASDPSEAFEIMIKSEDRSVRVPRCRACSRYHWREITHSIRSILLLGAGGVAVAVLMHTVRQGGPALWIPLPIAVAGLLGGVKGLLKLRQMKQHRPMKGPADVGAYPAVREFLRAGYVLVDNQLVRHERADWTIGDYANVLAKLASTPKSEEDFGLKGNATAQGFREEVCRRWEKQGADELQHALHARLAPDSPSVASLVAFANDVREGPAIIVVSISRLPALLETLWAAHKLEQMPGGDEGTEISSFVSSLGEHVQVRCPQCGPLNTQSILMMATMKMLPGLVEKTIFFLNPHTQLLGLAQDCCPRCGGFAVIVEFTGKATS